MPTYILLSSLTAQGVQTLKANPDRLREVNKDVEELGAKVLHQWATLGDYDFVNIVEAPDAATIARVSVSPRCAWQHEDPHAHGADDRRVPDGPRLSQSARLAQNGDTPGAPGLEELVRIDLVRPAEEVLLRLVVGRAVDRAPARRVG